MASAAKAVTLVVQRCEAAKESGLLDLSGCQLTCVPNAVYLMLKGYDVLGVSLANNQLKKFPDKLVGKFTDLKILNLAQNKIADICPELLACTSLKRLNLSHNSFTDIGQDLLQMEGLESLDLQHNQIQEFRLPDAPSVPPASSNNPVVDETGSGGKKKTREIVLSGNPLSESMKKTLSELDKTKYTCTFTYIE